MGPKGRKINTKFKRNIMIIKKIGLLAAVCVLGLSSCIKDEPLNSECDILSVTVPGDVLNREPVISNNKVTLVVKDGVDVTHLAPEFTLSEGAMIDPPSGTVRNFTNPQTYTTTSQNGEWQKTYVVEVQQNNSDISLYYDFETVRRISALGGMCSYDEFYELSATGQDALVWASANSAFALTLQGTTPNTFPTYQGDGGIDGSKCVVLVTRSTGSFGARVKKPMAAGNLFFGTFDGTNALANPLGATHFGIPFGQVPTYFSGYYKYTAGATYYEPDEDGSLVAVSGKTDMFNLYAVLYETSTGHEWLDGTDVLAADNSMIICTAEIPDRKQCTDWTYFSVPFTYRAGKSIDPDLLKAGKYNIAIVMSSSEKGDYFCGAIGSTLMVDELTLTCAE